jgi:hypothetical protein
MSQFRARHFNLILVGNPKSFFWIDLRGAPPRKTCQPIRMALQEAVFKLLNGASAHNFNALSVPSAVVHGDDDLLLQVPSSALLQQSI